MIISTRGFGDGATNFSPYYSQVAGLSQDDANKMAWILYSHDAALDVPVYDSYRGCSGRNTGLCRGDEMKDTDTIIELSQGPDGTYIPTGQSEKPKRTHKKRTAKEPKPENPTGRLDVLCSGVVEAAVKQSQNPFVRMAYDAFKPTVDQVFREKLGPQPDRRKRA